MTTSRPLKKKEKRDERRSPGDLGTCEEKLNKKANEDKDE